MVATLVQSPTPGGNSGPTNNVISDVAAIVGSLVAVAGAVNDIVDFTSRVFTPFAFASAGVLIVVGLYTARSSADRKATKAIASVFMLLASYSVVAANSGWPVLPIFDKDANGQAQVVRPVDNASITACHLTITYQGEAASGSAIVAATREKALPGTDQTQSFYFESDTQPGNTKDEHDIGVTVGKATITRDIGFDLFLYAVDASWVDYLRTSRQDSQADNSWWYSVGPPPHSTQLATRNVVRKKGTDNTC